MHRDLHGHRNDHALLECSWKWRLRSPKVAPAKDFGGLYTQMVDEKGNPIENKLLTAFENTIERKLQDQQYSAVDDDASAMYAKFCKAVEHAIEAVLPTKRKRRGVRRKVSDRTKALYEKRRLMKGTRADYKQVQGDIKTSSLQDYEDWVGEWADRMQEANGRGDTKGIYDSVKALARKRTKPPTNIATDQQLAS